jgi:hypothetical protein
MWHAADMLSITDFLAYPLPAPIPSTVEGRIEPKCAIGQGLQLCGAQWRDQFPPSVNRGPREAHKPRDFRLIVVEISENIGCKHNPDCML